MAFPCMALIQGEHGGRKKALEYFPPFFSALSFPWQSLFSGISLGRDRRRSCRLFLSIVGLKAGF